jgi:uncharacterized membrane protein HdeD (DUF308 family)
MLALTGVLAFIVGRYAVRNVLLTIIALALLLGIFWIVDGARAASAPHRGRHRGGAPRRARR